MKMARISTCFRMHPCRGTKKEKLRRAKHGRCCQQIAAPVESGDNCATLYLHARDRCRLLQMGRGRLCRSVFFDEALRGQPHPRRYPQAGVQNSTVPARGARPINVCRNAFRSRLAARPELGLSECGIKKVKAAGDAGRAGVATFPLRSAFRPGFRKYRRRTNGVWRFPSVCGCRSCHRQKSRFRLSSAFSRHLNRIASHFCVLVSSFSWDSEVNAEPYQLLVGPGPSLHAIRGQSPCDIGAHHIATNIILAKLDSFRRRARVIKVRLAQRLTIS